MPFILKNRHITLLLVVFAALFYLVFPVQMYTPLHSDDYSYFFNGGDIAKIYNHYMSWSGRLSADITSSTMLYYLSKPVYSALNSLALIALVFLISYLPANLTNRKINFNDIAICVVVFLSYWVANTNLGQTSFWIVGSANYLWTNLYILIYINLLVSLTKKTSGFYLHTLCLFVTGIIAGCTNENTGIFACLFSIFLWIFFLAERQKNQNIKFAVGSAGTLLGWLVLILAPGNSIRAQHISFINWYSQSISWRVDEHVLTRFSAMMGSYWQIFLITIFVSVAFNLIKNHEQNKNNNLVAKAAIFFFFTSVLSALMLIGAPVIPERSGNGTLVFLLIMFAFVANIFNVNSLKTSIYINLLPLFFLLSYFIPSYHLIYRAYSATHYQEIVRGEIIKSSKMDGNKNILIPDFNFSRLIKLSDRFDSYHNADAMGRYWGVEPINIYQVPFNYGVIVENDNSIRTIVLDKELSKGVTVSKLFIYEAPKKPFYKTETHLLTELSFNPETLPKNQMIYMHLSGSKILEKGNDFVKTYGFINADIGRGIGYRIGEKYYVDQVLLDGITANDIENIDIGIVQ